jgi:hypothetical protein
MVNDATVALASTVTVEPLTTVTLSDEVGTTPPTHVVVALQLPPTVVEDIDAANADELARIRIKPIVAKARSRVLFVCRDLFIATSPKK